MKINYSKEADAIYVRFSDKKIEDTDQINEDIIIDYDEDGKAVAIEILNASRQADMGKIIIEAINKNVLVGHDKCEISL
ncbi:DUF2283 domain-containing protein [Athalassotoga saccharophila]|uniref:DUF2283 domain-containing protein n=1 Tax=Athalassotoga saccharophila TaxID=1441386 RepID=A0A6N4TEE5_9BACT|nr:DUF2283 domain-containing protein [Athalassotoga saccharophila]BBJ29107.1 hypothetical protein ATHSA_p20017 [Athalassotoga saccharophila]